MIISHVIYNIIPIVCGRYTHCSIPVKVHGVQLVTMHNAAINLHLDI